MIRIILVIVLIAASTPAFAQWRSREGAFFGAAVGGVIGALIRPPQYYQPPPQPYYDPSALMPEYSPTVMYCIQRFRSYDPRTGVYIGYDGRYHQCP
jgi:hypothetical protein